MSSLWRTSGGEEGVPAGSNRVVLLALFRYTKEVRSSGQQVIRSNNMKCLWCGREITFLKRIDSKFCNDLERLWSFRAKKVFVHGEIEDERLKTAVGKPSKEVQIVARAPEAP